MKTQTEKMFSVSFWRRPTEDEAGPQLEYAVFEARTRAQAIKQAHQVARTRGWRALVILEGPGGATEFLRRHVSPRHNVGDIVAVYQKPVTRELYEGHARLEKFILCEGDGLERWVVRFAAQQIGQYEEECHERTIAP